MNSSAVDDALRTALGAATAALARGLGDLDRADDMVQDGAVAALQRWPTDGIPDRPDLWLVTVARHRAIDRWRRDARLRDKIASLERDARSSNAESERDWLSLLFTCCHPTLTREAQVTLTLRTVCGLTVPQIASAFLTTETTIAQRIVRAKRKLAQVGVPFRVPPAEHLHSRLDTVLTSLYLMFNEGYLATGPDAAERPDLAASAEWLTDRLAVLMPRESEVMGLLALIRLHRARRASRFGADGTLIELRNQDRTFTGGFNGGGDISACCGIADTAGGGGGASDLRRAAGTLEDRILVAGGGGGGGGDGVNDSGEVHGGNGAASGTGTAATAGADVAGQSGHASGGGPGGQGATGGAAGTPAGNAGSPGQGGATYYSSTTLIGGDGGAGGGGYVGGGSGGGGGWDIVDDLFAGGGGGGGGSDYVTPDALSSSVSDGAHAGAGQVRITYTPPLDTTAPQITPHITGTLGIDGWYVSDVTLTWTVSEPDSPNTLTTTGCADQSITNDQPATDYSCSASSAGGSAGPVTVTIKRDATAPANVSGAPTAAPDGSSGWYRTPVPFAFTGSDPTSGVASCSTPTYAGPDGAGVTVTGTCTDHAGNTSAAVRSTAIDYDATKPVLAPVVSPDPVLLHGPVSVTPGAQDATSGVATATCGPVSTAATGPANVTCTATDAAGNTATASATYVVQYVLSPLLSPAAKSKWKARSTVPVKIQVLDATGRPIPTTEASALGCRIRFTATGAQSATGCLTYNAAAQQFQYTWKLANTTGAATVTVSISYPGTATTTSRSTSVTITP